MLHLSSINIGPLVKSSYVTPWEMHYTLNGISRKWDFIETHDSVVVIIFNVTRKVLVCVRQFRPVVYVQSIPCEQRRGAIDVEKYPVDLGMSLEFCAGLIDKNISLEELAKAEVMEETGYDISVEKIEKVRQFRSVGCAAGEAIMYYVEVEDHMKTGKGGGLEQEGEFIEIVEMTIDDAKKVACGDHDNHCNYGGGFLFGLYWFLYRKLSILENVKRNS